MGRPVLESRDAPEAQRQPLIGIFNFLPSTYCQPSWLPPGLQSWPEDERHQPAHPAHRYVSPWLLARHRLSCDYELSCEDPRVRLALLDVPALSRLAWALGLLGCQSTLRRTVQREVLRGVREASGIDDLPLLMAASMNRFHLQVPPQSPADLAAGSLPRVRQAGEGFLWGLLAGHSRAVKGRLRMKLWPMSNERRAGHRLVPDAQAPAFCAWMADTLVPRLLPTWAWLF